MDTSRLIRKSAYEWEIPMTGAMRVPAVIFADEALIADMDDKVAEQATNVAALPGIVKGSFAMPDAHWGYGFPIGGVAAFDADAGGVVSAGGGGVGPSCRGGGLLTRGRRAGIAAAPTTSMPSMRNWPRSFTATFRPASAPKARSRSTTPRWTPCWRAAPRGGSGAAGARATASPT